MKRIGIEALLRWAYRDELPKDGASYRLRDRPQGHGLPWESVKRQGELLTVVDGGENCWGVVPDYAALTEPHPDAKAVGRAVAGLSELEIGEPADWNPLEDMGDLGRLGALALERAREVMQADRLQTTPAYLVRRHAVLGGVPVWEAEPFEVKVEMAANGKAKWFRRVAITDADGVSREIEVNGYDARLKAPSADAYRKEYLDPDPVRAIVARAEYEVWRAALDLLVEDLSADGVLVAHVVEASERPWRPWITGDVVPQRTLEALAAPVVSWPLALWGGRGLKQYRAESA